MSDQYKSQTFGSNFELYSKITEEIQLKRFDKALEILNYIEKILENNSIIGKLDLKANLLALHTSSYCYFK